MKASIPFFKGEIPRMAPRLLPDGYAQKAINARLFSGDLTAWNIPSSFGSLTPVSTLHSIYRMQTAPNPFLRSFNDVNWARGPIAGDTNETILFTGFPDNPSTGGSISASTAQPKITQYGLATGTAVHTGQTAGNYPNDWRLLGSPSPPTAPGASSVADTTTAIFETGATDPPTGWTLSSGTIHGNTTHSKLDTTAIVIPTGTDLSKDHVKGQSTLDMIQFNFVIGTIDYNELVDSTNLSQLFFKFSSTSGGDGPVITLNSSYTSTITIGSEPPEIVTHKGSFSFGTSSTFTGAITNTDTTSIDLFTNIAYKLVCSIASKTDGTFDATTTITDIVSGAMVLSRTNNFTAKGTWADYRAASAYSAYIDEIYTGTTIITDSTLDESTSYVYTYLNQFGQESSPSPASDVLTINPGRINTIIMTDPVDPDKTNYGLTSTGFGTKYLYRAATGANGLTDYFFVASIPYGTFSYIDSLTDAQLGETLATTVWHLPPADGFNVIALPNGITVMASKNTICPSVIAQPHSYPLDYRLTTDFPIVGMGAIDTTVVILTQANPYIVQGSDPSTLSMAKIELPYGCVSKRSIAHLKGYGVVYASANGLVAINGAGAQLITNQFFTREQWQAINPASIYAWVHDDRYFFTYTLGSGGG